MISRCCICKKLAAEQPKLNPKFKPQQSCVLLNVTLCCNASHEQIHISSQQRRQVHHLVTGNMDHLCRHARGHITKTTVWYLHAIRESFLTNKLSSEAQKQKHTYLLQILSEIILLNKDFERADKKIYRSPSRIRVYWIYGFLKQCSRKHKLQENFTVSYASWRKHSTSDPWTVTATAGIYKGTEKGA